MGVYGAHLLDVSQPGIPQILFTDVAPFWSAGAIAPSQTFFLLADLGNIFMDSTAKTKISVYTLSASPRQMSSLQLDGWVIPLDLTDTKALLARWTISGNNLLGSVELLDLSNLSSPQMMGTLGTFQDIRDAKLSGDTLFLANNDTIEIYDIRNPSSPQMLSHVVLSEPVGGLNLSGNVLLVLGEQGTLWTYDISNLTQPAMSGSLGLGCSYPGWAGSGNHYYVFCNATVAIVDISNPSQPTVLHQFSPGGWISSVAVTGGHLMVLSDDTLLQVFDVTQPTAPVQIGALTFPLGGGAWSVALSPSGYAYVRTPGSNGASVIRVINVQNPAHPQIVASVSSTTDLRDPRAVSIRGQDYLFSRDWNTLTIWSLADPLHPSPIQQYTANRIYGYDLVDTLLYVANDSELAILGVSDPAQLHPLGRWIHTGGVHGVHGMERTVYVAVPGSLMVLDLQDPANPTVLGSLDLGITGEMLAGGGVDPLIVGWDTASVLKIVDVSTPESMRVLSEIPAYSDAWDTYRFDQIAYVSSSSTLITEEGTNGVSVVRVFDLTTPSQPVKRQMWYLVEGASFSLQGDLLGVTGGSYDGGMLLFRLTSAAGTALRTSFSRGNAPRAFQPSVFPVMRRIFRTPLRAAAHRRLRR